MTYCIFPVPLARVITPFIPYIHSLVHFHLFVIFVVLVIKPLYNFLDVFNFSLGVSLFHFIYFSILLCFFSFSVVTRLLFIHFFMHFVNLFCVLYLFLWHFSLCLYSFFTFWHCYTDSLLHKQVLYNALVYLIVINSSFNFTH